MAGSLCLWVYVGISRTAKPVVETTPKTVAETETPQVAPAEPDTSESKRILAVTIRSGNFVCHNVTTIKDEGETALGRTGRVNCDGHLNYLVIVRPNGDVVVRAL